jgi:UDP-N-acetyl-2-amino-2-deoxyglucuronate dehydrogenase
MDGGGIVMDHRLGYCIVGAGNAGKIHAQALACIAQARLVAVVDRQIERAHGLASSYGAAAFTDFQEAFALPDVEVVCVCTPSGYHLEPGAAAAASGKHVVIEKPLDVTLERADRLLAAAAAAPVKTTCVLPYRFKAGSRRASEAIAAGRLGRISLVEARVPWWRSQAYYDSGGRRAMTARDGGGAIIAQALHAIDLMLWLAGPAAAVYGCTARLAHQMETEDTGVAVLTLASGALATIAGGTGCWPGTGATVGVYGDRGSIVLCDGRIESWKLADAAPEEEEAMRSEDQAGAGGSADPTAIGYEAHRRQLADMTAAILEDRRPFVTGADGRPCLAAICALYESARTGKTVKL